MTGLEEAFCGIDIGTTHVKAVLFTSGGAIGGVGRTRTPVVNDGCGDCHEPQQIYDVVCQVVRQAVAGSERTPIIGGVGVTSVGEEGVPLGPDGQVLYPAIAWYERRSSVGADAWCAQHDPSEFFEVTGLHRDLGFSLFKWLWLRSYRAEEWSRCTRWLGLADYVCWRLTGEVAMAVSHASRTGVLDLRARWWREDWAAEGLARGTGALPPLVRAGEMVGTVVPDAVAGVRFLPGAPVVLTGLDHAVGGFAAGVRDGSEVLDSMGTAEAVMRPNIVVPMAGVGERTAFDFNVGLDGESFVAITGLGSGASIEAVGMTLRAGRGWSVADLERIAREAGPGAGGLLYFPARAGRRKGAAFVGYSGTQGPGHVYRALLEGLSFTVAGLVDDLGCATAGSQVVCIGGGTGSRLWLEIKASVFGAPVRVVRTPEVVATGAALFAASCVLGSDIASQWSVVGEEVLPVPEWDECYQGVRESRREALESL